MEAPTTQRILKVIQTEIGEVSPASAFADLEVDSLEFLSLCQTLEKEFSVKLGDQELASCSTVEELIELVQHCENCDHVSN